MNSGWRAWLLRCTEETPSERFPDADEALSQLPRAGTSLRYAEMPFEREGRHVEGLASPYREGAERSSEGAEANLREAEQTRRILKPWATFLLILAGISFAFYGLWQLYRNAYHSPFVIYKCDHPGIDHAYKLQFGLFEGGVQWRGWFQGEMRSSSGQWSLDDDGRYHLRVSLLRKRLPEREESPRAFRAVDVLFKKQSSLDERAKDKRYKRWVDVLEYNPDLDRFLLIKRLETGNEEYFPGSDHEDRVKLYDQEAFDKGAVKKIIIHFIPFAPPDSTK